MRPLVLLFTHGVAYSLLVETTLFPFVHSRTSSLSSFPLVLPISNLFFQGRICSVLHSNPFRGLCSLVSSFSMQQVVTHGVYVPCYKQFRALLLLPHAWWQETRGFYALPFVSLILFSFFQIPARVSFVFARNKAEEYEPHRKWLIQEQHSSAIPTPPDTLVPAETNVDNTFYP